MRQRITAYQLWSAVVVAGIATFLFATLRAGLDWDGDYALYVMNARNIAERNPYALTPFIANPANPIHPAAYPPGLPLLLAPVYLLAGIDLDAMRAAVLATFGAFPLLVYARIARDWLPSVAALAAIAALGLHPYVWEFKDTIFSEFPFMLFCYAALHLLDRLSDSSRPSDAYVVATAAGALSRWRP